MSNVKHPKCAIRSLAQDAKSRLAVGSYKKPDSGADSPPKGISPAQKRIYVKLRELLASGEEIVNPIEQLADKELLATMPHGDRQRYILELSSDYVAMKRELMNRLAASDRCDSGKA